MKRNFIIGLLGLFLMTQSCKNDDKKKEPAGTDTTTSPAPVPSPAPAAAQPQFTSYDFPVLYAEWNQIEALFTEPGVGLRRKIVFRFDFDGTNSQPNLSGYPAKNGGGYTSNTNPLITLSKSTGTPVTINTPFYLGNIELSRQEYTELRDNAGRLRYLVFIPKKSTKAGLTNVITYYTRFSAGIPIMLGGLKPYDVGDELNPSPPRDPQ